MASNRRAHADRGCVADDRRGHLPLTRVPLDVEQRRHLDAARRGDAAEIVADHVHDHDVLGPVLRRRLQRGALPQVVGRPQARGAVPFIGRHSIRPSFR
jgi:hypothetical protein